MKPGFKTSEFWLTVIAQLLGVLALTGVVTPEQVTEFNKLAVQVIGGCIQLVTLVAYIMGRSKVKTSAVES